MFSVTGAHRTGKTTLAREFAKQNDFIFLETSVSAIFKELGYDPAATYDFATRLTIQEEVLKRLEALYRAANDTDVITDRCPLDLLAYTTAEAFGDRVPEDCQERFKRYVDDCMRVMNRHFCGVIIVQPGIPIVEEEGKAALNLAYMEHLNTLIRGYMADERMKVSPFYVPRHALSLEERVRAVGIAVNKVNGKAHRELTDYLESGNQVH